MNELIITEFDKILINPNKNNEEHKNIKFKDKFIKILGIYQIENHDTLLYIKEVEDMGNYKKHTLFKIETVCFYVFNNENIDIGILTDMCKFLSNSFFFYSLNKLSNDSFLWNEFPIKIIEEKFGIHEDLCFLYCGYFGKEQEIFKYFKGEDSTNQLIEDRDVKKEEGNKIFLDESSSIDLGSDMTDLKINDFQEETKGGETKREEILNTEMCLLSLISKERIGPRFLCRGIDDNSNVAMFVKTKFNFDYKLNNECKSFSLKIYRGSIPLFWQQTEDMKKSLYFLREPGTTKTIECFKKHFENIKNEDKIIFVINLLGNRKTETILTNHYIKLLDSLDLLHATFDLNKYQLNYEILKIEFFKFMEEAIKKIKTRFKDQNFKRLMTNKIIFRVNCLDCLDRTNVAQMLITEYIMKEYTNYNTIDSTEEISEKIERGYKKIWAENGNNLSIFYSNTNAHKNELSSKGTRTIFGLIDDILISASRVVYGNFTDKQKDVIIKSLLNINPEDNLIRNYNEEQKDEIKEIVGLINYSIYEETELEKPFKNIIKNFQEVLIKNSIKYVIISIQILKNYIYTKNINLEIFIDYLNTDLGLNLITKKVFKSNIILLLEKSINECNSDIINIEFSHSNTYDIFNIKYLLKMSFKLKTFKTIKTINVYSILVTDFAVFQSLKKRLNEKEVNLINISLLKNGENSDNENQNRINSVHLLNEFLMTNVFKRKYTQIECKSNLQNNLTYFNGSLFKERLDVNEQDSRPYLLVFEL